MQFDLGESENDRNLHLRSIHILISTSARGTSNGFGETWNCIWVGVANCRLQTSQKYSVLNKGSARKGMVLISSVPPPPSQALSLRYPQPSGRHWDSTSATAICNQTSGICPRLLAAGACYLNLESHTNGGSKSSNFLISVLISWQLIMQLFSETFEPKSKQSMRGGEVCERPSSDIQELQVLHPPW